MTYFGFLARFLLIPLLLLLLAAWRDRRHGRRLPGALTSWPPGRILLILAIVAVVYTTPWDNYLVATGVWWYDPALVSGLVIGWVPIEEYTFFVLQTLFTGLWFLFLGRRLDEWALIRAQEPPAAARRTALRAWSSAVVALIWLASIVLLASGWPPGTYLALELSWALVPVLGQLAFGADILWTYRRLLFWTIAPTTAYLCLGDALAIQSGTWTIDPIQSTGLLIAGLPLEEIVFFLMTNVLVAFGFVLILAQESQRRVPRFLRTSLRRPTGAPARATWQVESGNGEGAT